MADIILYLSLMLVCGIIGAKFREFVTNKLWWRGKIQTIAIVVLVFFMGSRMGCNEQVIDNIGTLGITALVMTIVILFFSVLCLFFLRKIFGFDKEASLVSKKSALDSNDLPNCEEDSVSENKSGIDKMTIIIFLSVVCGMAIGYFVARPIYGDNIDAFDHTASVGLKIGLCVLMSFVGLDLGVQGEVLRMLREAGLKILIFPIATIIGTFIGAAISGPLLGISLKESMAIGAGFGWYTFAPGIIMDAGLIEASAISFLHNVLREIMSILSIPFIAKKVGYIEAACMSGAPAMDVCLPIVSKETQGKAVTYGFVTGMIMSLLVPVLVPLALSIF